MDNIEYDITDNKYHGPTIMVHSTSPMQAPTLPSSSQATETSSTTTTAQALSSHSEAEVRVQAVASRFFGIQQQHQESSNDDDGNNPDSDHHDFELEELLWFRRRLETLCTNMRRELVVYEWQLPLLDSRQWEKLGAPIGLAVAVQRQAALLGSIRSDDGIGGSGDIHYCTPAPAAAAPPPPETTSHPSSTETVTMMFPDEDGFPDPSGPASSCSAPIDVKLKSSRTSTLPVLSQSSSTHSSAKLAEESHTMPDKCTVSAVKQTDQVSGDTDNDNQNIVRTESYTDDCDCYSSGVSTINNKMKGTQRCGEIKEHHHADTTEEEDIVGFDDDDFVDVYSSNHHSFFATASEEEDGEMLAEWNHQSLDIKSNHDLTKTDSNVSEAAANRTNRSDEKDDDDNQSTDNQDSDRVSDDCSASMTVGEAAHKVQNENIDPASLAKSHDHDGDDEIHRNAGSGKCSFPCIASTESELDHSYLFQVIKSTPSSDADDERSDISVDQQHFSLKDIVRFSDTMPTSSRGPDDADDDMTVVASNVDPTCNKEQSASKKSDVVDGKPAVTSCQIETTHLQHILRQLPDKDHRAILTQLMIMTNARGRASRIKLAMDIKDVIEASAEDHDVPKKTTEKAIQLVFHLARLKSEIRVLFGKSIFKAMSKLHLSSSSEPKERSNTSSSRNGRGNSSSSSKKRSSRRRSPNKVDGLGYL